MKTIGYSQTTTYQLNDSKIYLSKNILSQHKDDEKVKIRFTNIDNGNYFVINKLMYGNKEGKSMVYIKDFDIFTVISKTGFSYYSFSEAFPKGGFYKDGATKLIFDQKATRYSLDNDVLDIKLWVTNEPQPTNDFVNELRSIGLLKNIPETQKVVAVVIYGIEFDTTEFEKKSFKSSNSDLNDFRSEDRDILKIENECRKKIYDEDTLAIAKYPKLNDINFKYKTIGYRKKVSNSNIEKYSAQFTRYRNDDDLFVLYFTKVNGNDEETIHFIDVRNNLDYNLILKNNEYKLVSVHKRASDNCDQEFNLKPISNKSPLATYYYGKKSKFHLISVKIDEKNYPNMINEDTKNGFITSTNILYNDFSKITTDYTIETGNYNFKLSQ